MITKKIIVNVVIFPELRTLRAEIDASVPYEKTKEDLVGAIGETDPNGYLMFIAPSLVKQSLDTFTLSSNDWIALIKKGNLSGSTVKILQEQ